MDAITNDPSPAPRPVPENTEPSASDLRADELMIDAVAAGRRGTDDPDPLVRLLARWRDMVRRPRRRDARRGGPPRQPGHR